MTTPKMGIDSEHPDPLDRISLPHHLVAGFIGLNAAAVAYFGLIKPGALDRKFTWVDLPPLHARFVGALYLFGAVLLLGSLFCHRWAVVAPLMTASAIFTTSMLVLTFVNWDAFEFDTFAPKVWLTAYLVFPLMTWPFAAGGSKRSVREDSSHFDARVPRSQVVALRALASAFGVAGGLLLVARSAGAEMWPWKVSSGVAQFYGGPFLTLAWCAWSYSKRTNRRSLTLYTAAMAALGVSVIVISIKHRALFDTGDPAAWVWFALFGAIALGAIARLVTLAPTTWLSAHRRPLPTA